MFTYTENDTESRRNNRNTKNIQNTPKTPKYIFKIQFVQKSIFKNWTFIRISVFRSFVWPGSKLFLKLFPLYIGVHIMFVLSRPAISHQLLRPTLEPLRVRAKSGLGALEHSRRDWKWRSDKTENETAPCEDANDPVICSRASAPPRRSPGAHYSK